MTNVSLSLNDLVKLSFEDRQKMRKWLVKQSEELQLEAFERQKKYYFALSRHKNEDKPVLYFAAHTLAVSEIHEQMHHQKSKNKELNLDGIDDTTRLDALNAKKKINTPQMDWLLNHKAKIIGWSKNGMSSRKIKKVIFKTHKNKRISHAKICEFLKKMKEE
jgi:hypothetical protein